MKSSLDVRRCIEPGCDKILSIYNRGPKCFFHSLDKEAQKELNQWPSLGDMPLCSSSLCGVDAHNTFSIYQGYRD
jgi:hypothetical protein